MKLAWEVTTPNDPTPRTGIYDQDDTMPLAVLLAEELVARVDVVMKDGRVATYKAAPKDEPGNV